jgi:hypothetical protein
VTISFSRRTVLHEVNAGNMNRANQNIEIATSHKTVNITVTAVRNSYTRNQNKTDPWYKGGVRRQIYYPCYN